MSRACVPLLFLCGCTAVTFESVVEDYDHAVDARGRKAARFFVRVRDGSAGLLREGGLSPKDRLHLASLRIRACVETQDDDGAEAATREHMSIFRTLDPDARWSGDSTGIALLKAAVWSDDPDRAIGYLDAADVHLKEGRMQAFLDLRRVELLLVKARLERDAARVARALGTALALCDAHKDDERFAGPRAEIGRLKK